MFNPSRLDLARKRRGLTKSALAQQAGIGYRTLTDIERAKCEPSKRTLAALAAVLDFPEAFFARPDIDLPEPENANFRSFSRMTRRQRDCALGAGALAFDLHDWITERFALPAPQIPDLPIADYRPEAAAAAVRSEWGLGERPIKNLIHLLEAKGARVFSLMEDYAEVDAFSVWRREVPFVFLNSIKTAEHSRFDAAHELGHLVMHRKRGAHGRERENEADRFASSFLMSEGDVLAIARRGAGLSTVIQLKRRWGVSASAMARRLHDLGMLTDWSYRSICIELSRRGRHNEPEPMPREASLLLAKVFTELWREKVSRRHVAGELSLFEADLDAILFQGALVSAAPSATPKAGLSLVN